MDMFDQLLPLPPCRIQTGVVITSPRLPSPPTPPPLPRSCCWGTLIRSVRSLTSSCELLISPHEESHSLQNDLANLRDKKTPKTTNSSSSPTNLSEFIPSIHSTSSTYSAALWRQEVAKVPCILSLSKSKIGWLC